MVKGGAGVVEQGNSALMAELARALDLAQLLESHLSCEASSPAESFRRLAAEILSAIQKTILTVQSSAPGVPASAGASPSSESSIPALRDQNRKEMVKKRKTLQKWTTQVRLTPAAAGGVEGLVDDGYSWRKYGQKHILGAKHSRAYYRCTYQNTQGCPAAKQVQRSDDDPLLFDVTYLGTHSCRQRPPKRSASTPERKEAKQSPTLLRGFQSELRVKTEAHDAEEAPAESVASDGTTPADISPLIGAWSPDFLTSPYPVSSLDASDSDFTDIIGRANSASNSSLVDMDFLLDELELEQIFQFDSSGFFS